MNVNQEHTETAPTNSDHSNEGGQNLNAEMKMEAAPQPQPQPGLELTPVPEPATGTDVAGPPVTTITDAAEQVIYIISLMPELNYSRCFHKQPQCHACWCTTVKRSSKGRLQTVQIEPAEAAMKLNKIAKVNGARQRKRKNIARNRPKVNDLKEQGDQRSAAKPNVRKAAKKQATQKQKTVAKKTPKPIKSKKPGRAARNVAKYVPVRRRRTRKDSAIKSKTTGRRARNVARIVRNRNRPRKNSAIKPKTTMRVARNVAQFVPAANRKNRKDSSRKRT